jgi:hypothetical protein
MTPPAADTPRARGDMAYAPEGFTSPPGATRDDVAAKRWGRGRTKSNAWPARLRRYSGARSVAEATCQTRDDQRQRAELGRHLHATRQRTSHRMSAEPRVTSLLDTPDGRARTQAVMFVTTPLSNCD